MAYSPRLKEEYKSRVIAALTDEFGYKNVMQVPKLLKIVISKGVGAAVADKKLIDYAVEEVTTISGQKAISTISKKDVASFKLRKGMPIGVKVTLRGEKMYEFLDRLVTSALPRVRDFNGVKATGFDGRGNYNLGITEQIIFPEINIDKVNRISGMDITFDVEAASGGTQATTADWIIAETTGTPGSAKIYAHGAPANCFLTYTEAKVAVTTGTVTPAEPPKYVITDSGC